MAQLQRQQQNGAWQNQSFAALTPTPTDTFRISAIDGPGALGSIETPGRAAAYRMRVTLTTTAPAAQYAQLEVQSDIGLGAANPLLATLAPGDALDIPLAGEKYIGFMLRSYPTGTAGTEITIEFFE